MTTEDRNDGGAARGAGAASAGTTRCPLCGGTPLPLACTLCGGAGRVARATPATTCARCGSGPQPAGLPCSACGSLAREAHRGPAADPAEGAEARLAHLADEFTATARAAGYHGVVLADRHNGPIADGLARACDGLVAATHGSALGPAAAAEVRRDAGEAARLLRRVAQACAAAREGGDANGVR